jgi:hypothetical protein
MQPDRLPKVLQFLVVLLSVGATSVYATVTVPGAMENAWGIVLVAYLGGVVMPFVLRTLLNRVLESVGSADHVPVVMAVVGIFIPFILIPFMLSTTARGIAKTAEHAGVQGLDGARHRIGTLAVLYGASTFILPTIAAGTAGALLPFEFGWAIGTVMSGLCTAMILAVTTQLIFQFAETVVVETQGRAPVSLGGTGGESPVGVRSI